MKEENSGGHCEYYHCEVAHPQNLNQPVGYIANCEDIIQALGLTFDEGCEFKSIWRRGRGRQGFVKAESTPLRDAIKAVHYANRVMRLEERLAGVQETAKTRYRWDCVPEKFHFTATDSDGGVYMYECEPLPGLNAWATSGAGCAKAHPTSSREHVDTPDWRESLECRP